MTTDQDSPFPLNLFLTPKDPKEVTWHQALGPESNKTPASQEQAPSPSLDGEILASEPSDFSQEEITFLTDALLEQLKTQLGHQKFNLYFDHTLKISHLSSRSIIFSVSTQFLKTMIEKSLRENFSHCIKATLGKGIPFTVVYADSQAKKDSNDRLEFLSNYSTTANSIEDGSTNEKSDQAEVSDVPHHDHVSKEYSVHRASTVGKVSFSINDYAPARGSSLSDHELMDSKISQQSQELESSKITIDGKKNFDNFIVGPSNNLAHASSLAVAKSPGQVYQALYLYGNSGLGKTHLLHSIANYIIQHQRGMRIYLTTATEFMSEMINAIQEKTIQQFRKKYYELMDILIIDDIHELKNREGTQNEFFHIFNQLQKRKKQLIFTSDKEPKEITGIEERIKTRLSSALVVEIQQPDLETRIAILKRKSNDKDIHLSDEVINLIASNVRSNIRELEGSLIKLGAYSSIFKVDIDLQTAKEQLKIAEEIPTTQTSVETVVKVVSHFFKIPIPDIRSKSRSKDIAQARHIAMYLSYYLAKATLNEIGHYFSKRDHTSVIHAVNKVKALQKTDQTTGQLLYEIEKRLQS